MRLLLVLGVAAMIGFLWFQNQDGGAPAAPSQPSTVTETAPTQPILPVVQKTKMPAKKTVVKKPLVEEAAIDTQDETEIPQETSVSEQQPVQEETTPAQFPEALKFAPSEQTADVPVEYILRSSETVRPEVVRPLITLTYGTTATRFEDRDVSTKKRSGFLANSDED